MRGMGDTPDAKFLGSPTPLPASPAEAELDYVAPKSDPVPSLAARFADEAELPLSIDLRVQGVLENELARAVERHKA